MRALLLSNNPDYQADIPTNVDFRLIDGSALDVLIAARDLAHKGWILANHPLYGNFRPHQQPYRSLVLLPPDYQSPLRYDNEPRTPLDLLEEALALYQGPAPKCRPEEVPEHYRRDCALIDRELMRATLNSLA